MEHKKGQEPLTVKAYFQELGRGLAVGIVGVTVIALLFLIVSLLKGF